MRRAVLLTAIGTASGFLSGLFGIGGGLVIVPLLVLALEYDLKAAAGTSLAAVAVTAAIGSAAQATYGNVDLTDAAALGLPAVASVLVGIRLQARLNHAVLSILFAGLLILVAGDLAVKGLT